MDRGPLVTPRHGESAGGGGRSGGGSGDKLEAVAWPTASLRPSADCGWPIPSSAPSRCLPSCGSSSQAWERAPGRSARRWQP
eukprot:scaffold3170_cov54-Phaeocystis_antarctica.AAC.1